MPDRAVDRDALIERYGEPMGMHFALAEALPALKQRAIEEYKASLPRALVALSEDRLSLVFLVPSKGDEAQWWSICHWDYETDRMEPMYRIVDKGQDASDVLVWYEGELRQTKDILRDALRRVLGDGWPTPDYREEQRGG